MHPEAKICTPGAGYTLNFEHYYCCICISFNVYCRWEPSIIIISGTHIVAAFQYMALP